MLYWMGVVPIFRDWQDILLQLLLVRNALPPHQKSAMDEVSSIFNLLFDRLSLGGVDDSYSRSAPQWNVAF